MSNAISHNKYDEVLQYIVTEIKSTRVTLAHRVNSAMMQMYWNIGKRLSVEKLEKGYGGSVVKRLSADLQQEFPDTTGFSPRNLWNMKNFYEFYVLADEKVQRSVALLPWRHNILIISKVKTLDEAVFYINSALELGLTHDVLLNFIKADSYKNTKILPKHNNFAHTLPENLQEQASEILKSTYNLEMLGLKHPFKERELELRLVEKIKFFMLELGTGFTFIGNQHRLTHNDKEYFVDLLFFNRKVHSLVAIDLKIGEFEPEFVGKMNYYLGLLDDKMKQEDENLSIGIILCASKGKVDIELALRDFNKPIGVAEYQLQFPEKEIKELIRREIDDFATEKNAARIKTHTKN
ncbi:MAG: PDDEXK nuclease domain-containing protein [Streptococcaceae bacterium]|jgi:predicted nuclease of restriction endonuclease-like (RecB) superfamily|nr:PDDEXK nuclease domain-containing protein [Streptococcaceae bacterium]